VLNRFSRSLSGSCGTADRFSIHVRTLESVRTWIENRSAVPQDPDSAFVFFSELPSVKEIRVFLTTTRLMAVLDGRVRRNLDTTHNLNTHAFPTIVYGTDDADRHNHLAAAGILTHESRDFFSSVVEAVEEVRMRLKLQRLEGTLVHMADGSIAQRNGVEAAARKLGVPWKMKRSLSLTRNPKDPSPPVSAVNFFSLLFHFFGLCVLNER